MISKVGVAWSLDLMSFYLVRDALNRPHADEKKSDCFVTPCGGAGSVCILDFRF